VVLLGYGIPICILSEDLLPPPSRDAMPTPSIALVSSKRIHELGILFISEIKPSRKEVRTLVAPA
jgi:hypothetical protein